MKVYSFLFFLLFIFLAGCTYTVEKNNDFDLNSLLENSDSVWTTENVSSVKLLVFSLPDMDRKMCETFPKLIISNLEKTPGVIDSYFKYEGHKVFVYYDPSVVSKEELLDHESYSWIGSVFINESYVNVNVSELFNNRNNNNPTVMPEDHMLE